MAHKERLCVYWHCRRTGGTECWNWGSKFAGKKCPKSDACEHWRKKEIATRCAAVEVDIPDESELTEEDKRAAEEAAAEAAAKAEEEEAATELVKVKAQRRFLDKELNQIKDTGDEYAVSRERAAVLEEAGVAAVIEE